MKRVLLAVLVVALLVPVPAYGWESHRPAGSYAFQSVGTHALPPLQQADSLHVGSPVTEVWSSAYIFPLTRGSYGRYESSVMDVKLGVLDLLSGFPAIDAPGESYAVVFALQHDELVEQTTLNGSNNAGPWSEGNMNLTYLRNGVSEGLMLKMGNTLKGTASLFDGPYGGTATGLYYGPLDRPSAVQTVARGYFAAERVGSSLRYGYAIMLTGDGPGGMFTRPADVGGGVVAGGTLASVKYALTDYSALREFVDNGVQYNYTTTEPDAAITSVGSVYGFSLCTSDTAEVAALLDAPPDPAEIEVAEVLEPFVPESGVASETVAAFLEDSPVADLLPDWAAGLGEWLSSQARTIVSKVFGDMFWFFEEVETL